MKNISRYCGFLTVVLSWISLAALMAIQQPDWSEPISQFGFYHTTHWLFGVAVTMVAICWYVFSLQLNSYWRHTSNVTFAAGIAFIITGWVPYQPYVRDFIFDIHNLSLMVAVLLYVVPLWFIGYKKAHKQIAQVSRVLFFMTIGLVVCSLVARIIDVGIIYTQVLAVLPAHIWLIITNILLLQHHREIAAGYTGKL